ncbi:MAG: TRAM domain-containing protein [Rectinema sp.]|nr:TRAM domain-containing protein [Rectinema sp.]
MTAETMTLTVEKLSSHGEGIAFSEGKAIFIPFVIPGEIITCEITETHTSYARARLLSIDAPSSSRVQPLCPLFGICGGCALQHVDYDTQKRLKQDAARETFRRTGGFDPGELPIVCGKPFHYRNRTQVHSCADGGLGFTRAGSREPVRTRTCPTLVPSLERWLIAETRKAHPWQKLAALIGERRRFTAFSQDGSVYIEGRDRDAVAMGRGRRFQFPVGHFFQSNLSVMEMLIARHIEPLAGERALDLYSGAGLFSMFLAQNFAVVECVESDAFSMEAARSNLAGTPARIDFSCMPVERWVASRRSDSVFDCIIADPPRIGMTPEVRSWLATGPAPSLVYISCDHASMARDLKDLCAAGWEIEQLILYDFYPQTGRLEIAATLVHSGRKRTVEHDTA